MTTDLHRYIETDEAFYEAYEAYTPDDDLLASVREHQPTAHVVVPSRRTCSDCVRNVPRMTAIAEQLPGWTWDIFDEPTHPERIDALRIQAVPTFIIYDREGGTELGRIVENPRHGSLEADLLFIFTEQVH